MWLQNKFFREVLSNIAGMVASLIVLYPCAFWLVINVEPMQQGVKYKHPYLHLAPSLSVCLLLAACFLYFLIRLLRSIFSLIKKMTER